MTILVDYQGNLRCAASHDEGAHLLTTDAPQEIGGKGEHASPTDLVAVALGTCVMTMLGAVAQRSGLDLAGMQARVVKEMLPGAMRRIGTMKLTIVLPAGKPISEADRQKFERAVQACPVKQSLHPDIDVTMEFVYPN